MTTLHSLDLRLPQDKLPAKATDIGMKPRLVQDLVENYAVGSAGPASSSAAAADESAASRNPSKSIYYRHDLGLFQGVYEAWKNHWNLRTSPEDWWQPIAMKAAKAIDTAAAKAAQRNEHSFGSASRSTRESKVRALFVDHAEGKKKLQVSVPVYTIYQVNYDAFFGEMTSMIQKNIKNPEFASVMQNDFSTTTATHRVVSQVNLMAALQQFFEYEMILSGCGIKGVEMLGTQDDWDALLVKFRKLRALLTPIRDELDWEWRNDDWLNHVEMVFENLAKTFTESQMPNAAAASSKQVADFWMTILMEGEGIEYGGSGMPVGTAEAYNGWLIKFLLGYETVLTKDIRSSRIQKKLAGLNEVPMKITLSYETPPISDECQLQAGIMGFELHHEDSTFNQVPSVQPHHVWALKLPRDSPLRREFVTN